LVHWNLDSRDFSVDNHDITKVALVHFGIELTNLDSVGVDDLFFLFISIFSLEGTKFVLEVEDFLWGKARLFSFFFGPLLLHQFVMLVEFRLNF